MTQFTELATIASSVTNLSLRPIRNKKHSQAPPRETGATAVALWTYGIFMRQGLANMPNQLIRLQIEPLTEGGYVATGPDVPGFVIEADFLRDLREIAEDVAVHLREDITSVPTFSR